MSRRVKLAVVVAIVAAAAGFALARQEGDDAGVEGGRGPSGGIGERGGGGGQAGDGDRKGGAAARKRGRAHGKARRGRSRGERARAGKNPGGRGRARRRARAVGSESAILRRIERKLKRLNASVGRSEATGLREDVDDAEALLRKIQVNTRRRRR